MLPFKYIIDLNLKNLLQPVRVREFIHTFAHLFKKL
jgi:hypothetical protein